MVGNLLANMSPDSFARCRRSPSSRSLQQGVTFSVYSDDRGTEKIFPFCLVPRLIARRDWARLERGLEQRLARCSCSSTTSTASRGSSRDKVMPARAGARAEALPAASCAASSRRAACASTSPASISSATPTARCRVLEDNLRTPSGVSYVRREPPDHQAHLPARVRRARVHRVDHYPTRLAETLRSVSPVEDPETSTVVVLTPGPYNSAYFEHSFLARTMGLELVQAPDLFVDGDKVFVRTTRGPRRVHVIYRRTDDAFLDPEVFRPDSVLGVPGLMRAYAGGQRRARQRARQRRRRRQGGLPVRARHDPLLPRRGADPRAGADLRLRARRRSRATCSSTSIELVVKAVDEAGGYGMLMGPQSTAAERDEFRERIIAEPRRYIAQHRVELSTCPTWDRRGAPASSRAASICARTS